jgi:uncharacterized repeat protein (TIGR03803 family)
MFKRIVGSNAHQGTDFRLTTVRVLTKSHFKEQKGAIPSLLAKDDNLYGTTSDGSPAGYGTIYQLSLEGGSKMLHALMPEDGSDLLQP